jgi:hypothetical protein
LARPASSSRHPVRGTPSSKGSSSSSFKHVAESHPPPSECLAARGLLPRCASPPGRPTHVTRVLTCRTRTRRGRGRRCSWPDSSVLRSARRGTGG